MSNVLAARFASHTPVLVGAEKADWLSQALPMISAGIAKLDARMEEEPAVYMAQDDFWPAADSWLAAYRPYIVKQGTLQVPIKGMLLNEFGYQFGSWCTGYLYILKAIERGMEDPEVERIALVINSPGGEVAGCFDAVDKAFGMRGTKPINSFINEAAYSAAFAWASIGEKVWITRTGGSGSVGVVTAHMDVSKAMEKAGYNITFIHAGKHKVDGNPYGELPEPVKARIQKRIDSMYNIFVQTVARNLQLDEAVVRDTEALTYGAEESIEIGFAHEVRPFDEALAAYSGELENTEEEENVELTAEQEKAVQARIDTAAASAKAEGKAEGLKEGATAERSRLQGIMGCDEAKTRPTMATHLALNTELSVDSVKSTLAVSPAEKTETAKNNGADFKAAMEKDNPNLGAGADTDNGGDKADTAHDEAMAAFAAINGTKKEKA